MLLRSDLLGSAVLSTERDVVGHLIAVTVELGEDRPAIRRLASGRRVLVTIAVIGTCVVSLGLLPVAGA